MTTTSSLPTDELASQERREAFNNYSHLAQPALIAWLGGNYTSRDIHCWSQGYAAALRSKEPPSTTGLREALSFAWTPGTGSYKHFPPYVNLSGKRLTVRGYEDLSGEHPMMGATVSIDLPDEAIEQLRQALSSSPIIEDDVERVAEAIASELDALDETLSKGRCLWEPALFRKVASKQIARAAIKALSPVGGGK